MVCRALLESWGLGFRVYGLSPDCNDKRIVVWGKLYRIDIRKTGMAGEWNPKA